VQFSFDEQQREFRDQLRALAEKRCPPDALRASWASAPGWSRARWQELAALGVTGVTVPEAHGGLGLGLVDMVLLLEEAGRSGLPEPLLDTAGVAVPLLVAAGDTGASVRERWLPAVADGSAVLGVVDPGAPGLATAGVDAVLVAAGDELRVVVPHDGASRRSVDGRWCTALGAGADAEVVADGAAARQLLSVMSDLGALGAAAQLVGAATRLVDMAAAYAKERVQFGKPIGSFQAVKHHLASALVRVEFARPLVYAAAWSHDEAEPMASRAASMAKAAASDAGRLAARAALQVHGAIGYTWEHDLQLWLKRVWAPASSWGDARAHRARVLAAL